MSLRAWSRASVFVFLLVATSCLEGAAEDAENDNKGDSTQNTDAQDSTQTTDDQDSTQTTDDEDSPDPSGDTDHLRQECCLQGRRAASRWGSCPGKAIRYLKTVSMEDDEAKTCRLAFSGCCSRASNAATTSDSAPGKDVKQLGGGPTTSEGDTEQKVKSAPQQPTGPYELRKSCCDRGHQSLRQEGPCQVKARKYVRTTTLGRSDAKLCRLLFGACCYRASRVAKPAASPKMLGEEIEGAEERQIGGTSPGEDEDQKATEPVWKRRLTARCCNAGKRSAAATSGSCASRARLMTRKARFRSRRVQKKDSENCNQTFLRCCNEVPIV